MASWTFRNVTAVARAGSNAAVGPGTLTNAIGDKILYVTGVSNAGPGTPPGPPAGYSADLATHVLSKGIVAFERLGGAVAANETPAAVNWNDINLSWAFALVLQPVGGSAQTSSFDKAVDYASTSTQVIPYFASLLPTGPNRLLIAIADHIKTATTNGATIGNMTHDTAFGMPILANGQNGPGSFVTASLWQQTTATPTNASDAQLISIAESVGQNTQSIILALAPPTTGGGGAGPVLLLSQPPLSGGFTDL